jgi:type I restriction enzyme S subunit
VTTTDLLLAHFAAIADAPGGVARLRQLILQLAIQGRLVEQNPDDEPASVLLERIREEKARLVKAGIIGKARAIADDLSSEFPFTIPTTWAWVQLAEVCHDWGQKMPDAPFTYIDVSAIDNERGVISSEVSVLQPAEAPSRARKLVRPGTLIYSTVRPYLLNIAIVDREFTPGPIVSTAFAILHPMEGAYNRYLYYYLRSQPFIDYVAAQMKGVAYPAINDGQFFSGLVPLPPSAEQRRIVARVDALMAMCDALEQRQAQQGEGRRQLLTTLVNALLGARNAAEAVAAWARLSDSFDLALAAPEDVAPLRQAVLQLAIQGRLVDQDVEDEPASKLLERIRQEKVRLVKEGKIKKIEHSSPIAADEQPFDVPQVWEWARLGYLSAIIEYGTSEKASTTNLGVPVIRMNNIQEGRVELHNLKYVSKEIRDLPRLYLRQNDLLFNRTNSYDLVGKTGVFKSDDEGFTFASYLIRISILQGLVEPEYVNLAMNSRYYRKSQLEPDITQQTGQANFNGTKLAATLIPLPPLAEQRRIVARVEQLMALCDELEARLREERAAAERLSAGLCRAAAGAPLGGEAAPVREPAEGDSEEQLEAPEAPVAPPPAAAPARASQASGEGAAGDAQRAAAALLAERGALTNGDLQAALGLDAAAARALLKQLVAEGLARQEGERRGARYVRA